MHTNIGGWERKLVDIPTRGWISWVPDAKWIAVSSARAILDDSGGRWNAATDPEFHW